MVRGLVQSFIDTRCVENAHPDTWDLNTLKTDVLSQFGYRIETSEFGGLSRLEIENLIFDRLMRKYQEKEELVARTSCGKPNVWSCCRSSTISGKTTCFRWTT